MKSEKASFGAGCFWGVEARFREMDGVLETRVGYQGGDHENPSYEEVCTGKTGHAEVVEIQFDPQRLAYEDLLSVFWEMHDPTSLNRQGPDVGSQYRSAIFYHSPEQKMKAEAARQALDRSGQYDRPIVTEISPATAFYPAEEYHQRYLEKKGLSSCAI